MVEEGSKLFIELQEKKEKQLDGLRLAFEKSFEDYAKKSDGEYPDLRTSRDVDSYIGARRDLWNSIQRLDMILKDVTRIAIEVLGELRNKQKDAEKVEKE